MCYAPFNFYLTITRFASKVSQRKKFPVQLSTQNIHHCNQWNTSFLLIRYNGFANACFWWSYSSKSYYIHAIWIFFFNKLLRKTQISLGIHPVWSESLLCAQWVAKDSVLLHGDSEDSDQTGRMRRLIWVFAGAQSRIHRNRNRGLHGRNLSSTYFHDFYTRWKSLKSTPFLDIIKQCRKTHKLRKR